MRTLITLVKETWPILLMVVALSVLIWTALFTLGAYS